MRNAEVAEFRMQLKMLQRRLRSERPPAPGMSRTLMQVLGTVRRLPDGSQPTQVADALQMTSSNVAAALRELEAGGLIRRQKDAADARRVQLFVTARGSALVEDFRNERNTWFGQAVDAVLTQEEQRALVAAGHLLERLAAYES